MRRRRDPFARVTYVPERWTLDRSRGGQCLECGQRDPRDRRSHAVASDAPKARIYTVSSEHDGLGRSLGVLGDFCSWSCAEAYHGGRIGR